MEFIKWLNQEVPHVADALEALRNEYYCDEKIIGFAGKESVYKILEDLRSAMFPGVYEAHPLDEFNLNISIGNHVRNAAIALNRLIQKTLSDRCDEKGRVESCRICQEKADAVTKMLIGKLSHIRRVLQTDIQAAYEGDPAAVSMEEVILSYPALDALSIYRIAHELYRLKVPIIPRIMTEYAHQRTGIDIHPGAQIGEYFFIDHGTGVVIGETCVIGTHVKLYQGVTLGAKAFALDENGHPIKGIKRHPDIEDRVVIYAGATILGGDTRIGHDSVIGGNVWLTQSVPPRSKVIQKQPQPGIKPNNPDA